MEPVLNRNLLRSLLLENDFSLALAPGFFCFYAHIGFLHALEELGLLARVTSVAGSSAGALVGGFLASGMQPSAMIESVLKIDRKAIWDPSFGLGLLKGDKLQRIIEKELPRRVQSIEDAPLPIGVTTFNLGSMRTEVHRNGSLATAMRASACFPGLFSPVVINGTLHIDGGVFDRHGLVGLPENASHFILNVVFTGAAEVLPTHLAGATVLTVWLKNIPDVNPFSMDTAGPAAYRAAKAATLRALTQSCHVQQSAPKKWLFFVEAGPGDENARLEDDDKKKKRARGVKKSSISKQSKRRKAVK